MAIEVRDLDRTRDLLGSSGVAFDDAEGRLDVAPGDATGVALSFVAW